MGVRHPVDGYGAAGCRARPRRVAPRHAPRAGARARIRSARGHAPSIRCALRAALSNHRKGRAPLKSRDPPSLALTPCHARARDDGHKKGAARGESHRNKVPVRSPLRRSLFVAPGPTYRPSTRRNGPDPPHSPRNRARLSRSRAARRRSPAGAARARRPPGRPADRAAERGRQSRALPIGSASQCT